MNSQDSVALLFWSGAPERVLQDTAWVFDERDDSTNQLRATTTLAEADGVEDEQELIFQNRRFIVSGVERDRHADRATIVADEAQVELAGHVLTDFEFNSWTAFQALEHALKDTRWTPGEVENVRFGRAQFEDLTVLEACHFLANHQDAYVTFDSLRRRVNITVQRGTKHERVFTYGRELENIQKESRQPETTVIYPTGADDLTIEHVNNGRDYVEDYGYYTSRGVSLANARRWYRKADYWSDSRYEYASNMKRDAQKRLAEEAYPAITYTLTAGVTTTTDGTEDDLDLTDIGLGDTVYVWDDEIDAKLMAEVSAVTTSSDQSRNELVLSTLPESFGGTTRRGSGRYFGDSGSTAGDHPLFPRSGFQPRPSMPILENITDVGVGTVRWNGQDHDGEYTTIPARFGEVIAVVAKLHEDGSIPSPDSDGAYEGGRIHSRGGGLATVAFGAPGKHAVWFYMLGQDGRTRSQYSVALVVDVAALVDVDAIDAVQQDARDRIQAVRDQADQKYADYDQAHTEHRTNMANAQTALANAQQRLNMNEQELQLVQSAASTAQSTADQAVADALAAAGVADSKVEFFAQVSEPSGDRRKDGNLWLRTTDNKLHYFDAAQNQWVVSTDQTATDAANNAAQALADAAAAQAKADLLELSITGEGGLEDRLQQTRDTLAGKADQSSLDDLGEALSAIEVPDVSDFATQDDVDQAAQQAKVDAALDAQAKVDAARQDLENLISSLDFGDVGQIWAQADAPPAGVTYEWAGVPGGSVTVRRRDGVVDGHNFFTNPSFETGTHHTSVGSMTSLSRTRFVSGVAHGSHGATVQIADGANNANAYLSQTVGIDPADAGQWLGFSFVIRRSGAGLDAVRPYVTWTGGGTNAWLGGYELTDAPLAEQTRHTVTVQVPAGATQAQLWLRFTGSTTGGSPSAGLAHTDAWISDIFESSQDAIDSLATYYDGDTPDDRASDIWYDDDGIAHTWEKGVGWRVLEDPRITAALEGITSLQAQADQLHTEVGNASAQAAAAMNRAEAVKGEAQAHADNLPKVLHGTTPPAGIAPEGSIWWQHQGGTVVGQWNRENNQWRSAPVASQAIANLDLGKLTVGDAEIATAVLEKLFSNQIFANHVEALEAYIGGSAFKDGVIATAVLEAAEQIITGLFAAEYGLIEHELTVKGGLFANNATLIGKTLTENLTVEERADFVEAFVDELFAEEFTARVATMARAIVAAPNLIPHWSQISDGLPEGFEGFSHNPNDPSIYVTNDALVDMSTRMTLTAGEEYHLAVDVRSTVAGNRFNIALRNGDGHVGYIFSFEDTDTWLSPHDASFTVEETRDDYYLRFFPMRDTTEGFQWYANLRLTSALDGRIIAPGTIDVGHLNVTEAMTAALLRAKKIEVDDLDVNALQGMLLEGGIVRGGRVEGAALIGGRVDVGPRYTSGGNRGISLSENGVFRMYDSLGELSVIIDGVNNRFTGRLSTARPGSPGLILEPASSNANRPGIFMSPDGIASGNHGGVFTDNLWRLVLRGKRDSWADERNRIIVEGGFHITEGQLTAEVPASFLRGLAISGAHRLQSYSSAEFHRLIEYPGAPNSTHPANVNLGGSGSSGQYLRRTSSVRRSKVNAVRLEHVNGPLEYSYRLLSLVPKIWYDRHDLEQAMGEENLHLISENEGTDTGPTMSLHLIDYYLGANEKTVPGLIAEEVEDAGLNRFVTYETNEETGEEELSSVAYDRLWLPLIPIVKEHDEEITTLKQRIDDLEARIQALENNQ